MSDEFVTSHQDIENDNDRQSEAPSYDDIKDLIKPDEDSKKPSEGSQNSSDDSGSQKNNSSSQNSEDQSNKSEKENNKGNNENAQNSDKKSPDSNNSQQGNAGNGTNSTSGPMGDKAQEKAAQKANKNKVGNASMESGGIGGAGVNGPGAPGAAGAQQAGAAGAKKAGEEATKKASEEMAKQVAKEAGKQAAKTAAKTAAKSNPYTAIASAALTALNYFKEAVTSNDSKAWLVILSICIILVICVVIINAPALIFNVAVNKVEYVVGSTYDTLRAKYTAKGKYFTDLFQEKYGMDIEESQIYSVLEEQGGVDANNTIIYKDITDHAIEQSFTTNIPAILAMPKDIVKKIGGEYYESSGDLPPVVQAFMEIFFVFSGYSPAKQLEAYYKLDYPYSSAKSDGSFYTIGDCVHHNIPANKLNDQVNYAEIFSVLSQSETFQYENISYDEYYDLMLDKNTQLLLMEIYFGKDHIWYFSKNGYYVEYSAKECGGNAAAIAACFQTCFEDWLGLKAANPKQTETRIIEDEDSEEDEDDDTDQNGTTPSNNPTDTENPHNNSNIVYTRTALTSDDLDPSVPDILDPSDPSLITDPAPITTVVDPTTTGDPTTTKQPKTETIEESDESWLERLINLFMDRDIGFYYEIEIAPYGLSELYYIFDVEPYSDYVKNDEFTNIEMLDWQELLSTQYMGIRNDVDNIGEKTELGYYYLDKRGTDSPAYKYYIKQGVDPTYRSLVYYLPERLGKGLTGEAWDLWTGNYSGEVIYCEVDGSIIPVGLSVQLNLPWVFKQGLFKLLRGSQASTTSGRVYYMGEAGCIDTCFAMAILYFSQNSSAIPDGVLSEEWIATNVTKDSNYVHQGFLADKFCNEHGCTFSNIGVSGNLAEKTKNAIDAGNPLIFQLNSPWTGASTGKTYYGGSEHWMMIYGYDDSGIYVADPARGNVQCVPYDDWASCPMGILDVVSAQDTDSYHADKTVINTNDAHQSGNGAAEE